MDIQSVKKQYHLVRVVDDKGDVHTYKRFGHQKWIKRHTTIIYICGMNYLNPNMKKVIINWKS
jgi:hypothetical protein